MSRDAIRTTLLYFHLIIHVKDAKSTKKLKHMGPTMNIFGLFSLVFLQNQTFWKEPFYLDHFQRLLWFSTFNWRVMMIISFRLAAVFVIAVSSKALADFVHQLAHHKHAAMLHKSETLSSHAPVAA